MRPAVIDSQLNHLGKVDRAKGVNICNGKTFQRNKLMIGQVLFEKVEEGQGCCVVCLTPLFYGCHFVFEIIGCVLKAHANWGK